MPRRARPPQLRGDARLAGLANQGATCYLNSLLQALFMTPELRAGLFAVDPEDLGLETDDSSNETLKSEIATSDADDVEAAKAHPVFAELHGMGFSVAQIARAVAQRPNGDFDGLLELVLAAPDPMPQPPMPEPPAPEPAAPAALPGKKKKAKQIPLQLQQLFAQLQCGDRGVVNTDALTQQGFRWEDHDGRQQHDLHELQRLLLDALQASLKKSSGATLVRDLYGGKWVRQVRCLTCDNVSEREEDFYDLMVQVKGMGDLEASLASFTATERLEGANAYACETCGGKRDAELRVRLRTLPPLLSLSLARFDFNPRTCQREKLLERFSFPMDVSLASYREVPGDTDDVYDLFAVVVHRGTAFSGHYYAYVRDLFGEGVWSPPPEKQTKGKATPVPRTLGPEADVAIAALVVAFEGIAPDAAMGLPKLSMSALGGRLKKHCGAGWSDTFKETHGPLTKFLAARSDVFLLDQGRKNVFLAGLPEPPVPPANGADDAKAAEAPAEPASDAADATDAPEEDAPPEPSIEDISAAWAAEHGNWFQFNDESVSPADQRGLEAAFEGRDCAYMLLYRSRKLPPVSATPPMPPAHWTRRVDEEDAAMAAELEAVASESFLVTAELTGLGDYERDGPLYLRRTEKGPAPRMLELDRRWTAAQLQEHVFEAMHPSETTGALPASFLLTVTHLLPCGPGFHPADIFAAGEGFSNATPASLEGLAEEAIVLLVSDGVTHPSLLESAATLPLPIVGKTPRRLALRRIGDAGGATEVYAYAETSWADVATAAAAKLEVPRERICLSHGEAKTTTEALGCVLRVKLNVAVVYEPKDDVAKKPSFGKKRRGGGGGGSGGGGGGNGASRKVVGEAAGVLLVETLEDRGLGSVALAVAEARRREGWQYAVVGAQTEEEEDDGLWAVGGLFEEDGEEGANAGAPLGDEDLLSLAKRLVLPGHGLAGPGDSVALGAGRLVALEPTQRLAELVELLPCRKLSLTLRGEEQLAALDEAVGDLDAEVCENGALTVEGLGVDGGETIDSVAMTPSQTTVHVKLAEDLGAAAAVADIAIAADASVGELKRQTVAQLFPDGDVSADDLRFVRLNGHDEAQEVLPEEAWSLAAGVSQPVVTEETLTDAAIASGTRIRLERGRALPKNALEVPWVLWEPPAEPLTVPSSATEDKLPLDAWQAVLAWRLETTTRRLPALFVHENATLGQLYAAAAAGLEADAAARREVMERGAKDGSPDAGDEPDADDEPAAEDPVASEDPAGVEAAPPTAPAPLPPFSLREMTSDMLPGRILGRNPAVAKPPTPANSRTLTALRLHKRLDRPLVAFLQPQGELRPQALSFWLHLQPLSVDAWTPWPPEPIFVFGGAKPNLNHLVKVAKHVLSSSDAGLRLAQRERGQHQWARLSPPATKGRQTQPALWQAPFSLKDGDLLTAVEGSTQDLYPTDAACRQAVAAKKASSAPRKGGKRKPRVEVALRLGPDCDSDSSGDDA